MPIKNIKTVSYRSSDKFGIPIPHIPICGKFLNSFNFSVGSKFRVDYHKNSIQISKVYDDDFGDPGLAAAVRK